MLRNRSFIYLAYSFSSLGYAFIGIFYPILLKNAFGYSLPEAICLVSAYWALYTVLLYPLHWYILKYIPMSFRLCIGQLFLAAFYFMLHAPQNTFWYIFLTGLFFALSIIFYWGNLEFVMQKNTEHGKRGKFWGIIQSLTIGVNIIAPPISAYFLETNHASWIFLGGVIAYLVSGFSYLLLNDTSKPSLVSISPPSSFSLSILSEFFQHGVTGVLYPLLVVVTLGSMKIFGILLSIMSFIELVASVVLGHITDKISAKKMLQYGIIARSIDILIRVGLVIFPTFLMGGIISLVAPLCGPLYQPAYMSRLSRVIEKSEDSFSYWVHRGFLSGVSRVIFLPFSALLLWQFGNIGFIIAFIVASFSLLWVRKL